MNLVLRAVSIDDAPLSRPLEGRFDARGGDIGRSDQASFTLPDPERTISRVHARVSHDEHGYWIETVSSVGPILHNGRPLSTGMRIVLADGDELGVGAYRLLVGFEEDEATGALLRGRGQPTLTVGPGGATGAHGPAAPAATELTRRPPLPLAGFPGASQLRTAVRTVLEGFDPDRLERRLAEPGAVAGLAPADRRAWLWQRYREYHRGLRDEAEAEILRRLDELLRPAAVEAARGGVAAPGSSRAAPPPGGPAVRGR